MDEKNQEDNCESFSESKIRVFFRIIVKTFIWAMLIIVISIAIRALVFKKYDVLGYRAFIVMSGSMESTINTTDIVITKQQQDNFKIGDIIAFQDNSVVTVHRIVDISTNGEEVLYETKGDNNNTADQKKVKSSEIKGKVVYRISKMGKVILFIHSHILIFIFIIVLIIIGIIVRRLI